MLDVDGVEFSEMMASELQEISLSRHHIQDKLQEGEILDIVQVAEGLHHFLAFRHILQKNGGHQIQAGVFDTHSSPTSPSRYLSLSLSGLVCSLVVVVSRQFCIILVAYFAVCGTVGWHSEQ